METTQTIDFTGKTIAIAGYGKEGRSAHAYLLKLGVDSDQITICDQKDNSNIPSDVASIVGEDTYTRLDGFDVVFRSPSIRPDAIQTDGVIWSVTNEFFTRCPAKIVGVTGTNGKGTTCALLTEILRAAGKQVHLVGNIGTPALDVLDEISGEDIVVYELSSFQLWDLQRSPQLAVVLMITEDHLDKHIDMTEYVGAKAVIAKYQSADDTIIYNGDNDYSGVIAETSLASRVPYLSAPGAEVRDDQVVIEETMICSTEDIGLSGIHNRENVCAAVTAAWQFTQDVSAIRSGVTSFRGLPHRMELVATVCGVAYYNDSNSSVALATKAALDSFTGQKRILIFGGYDKGLDVRSALTPLTEQDHVVLIGQTGTSFEAQLDEMGVPFTNLGSEITMADIVSAARDIAAGEGVVLLSPAHPSYDMFDNLYQRGDLFREAVKSLSN